MGGIWLPVIVFIFLFLIVNRLWRFRCNSKACLVGKTALVTGGVSGIGYQAALSLASRGCRVIIADVLDTTDAVKNIIKETENPHIVGKKLDLASFQSVRDLAKNIIESEPKLNILINNAGIANENCIYTADGMELTMQVNYFGHFLLTHLLLDLLKKSSPSRIVSTSSLLAYFSNMTPENLNKKKEHFSLLGLITAIGTAYAMSKLCLALATKMFGEKLKGTGVIVNTFHPGAIRTNIFYRNLKTYKDFVVAFSGFMTSPLAKTPEEGAQTLLHLACASEVKNITGQFFAEGRRIIQPPQLNDKEFCDKIWERSISYCSLAPHEVKC